MARCKTRTRFSHRNKFPLMSDINMIPFIDVSLVLLIIFMVVTPLLMTSQIKVNLPKAVSGTPPDSTPIKIQITAKKNFYINDEAVLSKDLASILRSKFTGKEKPVVLIEADASVPFRYIIMAMDSAKSQGAHKLGVAVTSVKK